jgi:hypothetical protein
LSIELTESHHVSPATKTIASAILRMTHGFPLSKEINETAPPSSVMNARRFMLIQ